jgi:hypothetical protein
MLRVEVANALGRPRRGSQGRLTMSIGVLKHAARFAAFAYFSKWVPTVLINVFHQIC